MVQIIQERRKPSFSEKFSEAIGTGLEGAQNLYSQHLQKEQIKQENAAIKELTGHDISGIKDQKMREKYFELALQGQNKSQEMADKLIGNRKMISDLEEQRNLPKGSLSAYENDPNFAERVSRPEKQAKVNQADRPIDPDQLKKIKTVRETTEYQKASPLKKYQLLTDNDVSERNASAEAKIASEEEKPSMFETEASKLAAKSSAEYRDKVVREYEGAVSSDLRIDKMMKQAESGDLSTPLMVKTLEYVGLPLSVLNNPTTEEYAKLQNDYVRDVTSIFPGVIKNFEIESYMKTIPGLLNSDEGKLLVGKNVKLINAGKKLKYKATEKILEENKGITPRNLDMAVNDRIRNEMEDLKDKFMENIHEALDLSGPKITMIDERGKFYDIPSYDLENAMKDGLKISNE